ncbi:hypothetical protein EV188_101696 [Actinomycetospora succinea]|uniref:Uncharacterized protein n=1 Tax=Actinomycetospora succinea TaxID=663603 RepID=A0A4R6VS70_9PSEU|nr:hypothetical protein [Actinomycetospora succinea]TDQ65444.1 hypothetical protein EV188_101696 [Actinomycetospora succinea]
MTAEGGGPAAPRQAYEPPKQSVGGQLLDAVVVLALIFVTLFATTYITSAEDQATTEARPLAEQPLTPGERTQYQKMIDAGVADEPTLAAGVEANQPSDDKYEIDVLALIGTIVLLGLYLGFVYRTSFREYREVIEERFGPAEAADPTETPGRQR